MSDPIPTARLDEISALADAATVDLELAVTEWDPMPATVRVWSPGMGDFVADFWDNRADAEFYHAARTAVPELIAEVRRARAAEADAHRLLAEAATEIDWAAEVLSEHHLHEDGVADIRGLANRLRALLAEKESP